MENFEYQLGDIVILDPSGRGRGPIGKVVSLILNLDGSQTYVVSVSSLGASGITRHQVAACEMHKLVQQAGKELFAPDAEPKGDDK